MKILADSKILASHENIGGFQNIDVSWKYWRMHKMLAEKVGGPLNVWARRNLQLLTSSWTGWRALVQILVDMLPLCHVDPKWEHSPGCSAFMGGVPPILYRLLVPARHAKIYAEVKNIIDRAYFHQFLWKLQNSISAPKCPIIEPKICTWSLLLSNISYHTHDPQIRGHPRFLARLLKNFPKRDGGGTPCGCLSACAGRGSASSLRLYSWWHHFLLSVQCIFPPIPTFSVSQRAGW